MEKGTNPVFGLDRVVVVNVATEGNDVVILGAERAQKLRPEIIAPFTLLHVQICSTKNTNNKNNIFLEKKRKKGELNFVNVKETNQIANDSGVKRTTCAWKSKNRNPWKETLIRWKCTSERERREVK